MFICTYIYVCVYFLKILYICIYHSNNDIKSNFYVGKKICFGYILFTWNSLYNHSIKCLNMSEKRFASALFRPWTFKKPKPDPLLTESCLLTEENKKGVVSNSQQHSGAGVYMKGIKKVELIKGQQGKNISGNKSLGQRKHIITHCKQRKWFNH